MTYLFANGPLPAHATGVPVTLTVTDSNNNTYVIGTTTSNAQGTYGLTWTPTIPGNFIVTATFAGSGAYYGSSATSYFCASPAPAEPTATPVENLASNTTVEIGIVAIAIIIIVIGAVLAMLVTRKHP